MSQKTQEVPGFPAASPTYEPVATQSGALDITGYTDPTGHQITPTKTFNYAMPGGGTRTFYYHMKTSVTAALKSILIAAGLAT